MNILFFTMVDIQNLEDGGIYSSLMKKVVDGGHKVYIACPAERRLNEKTSLRQFPGYSVLRIRVGNLQKTNIIEKGISTVLLETQFLLAINKYFSDVKFDLVMYSTPPITLAGVVKHIKKRDGAISYLMLKDIFPQNAVDIEMMSKTGLMGIIYKYFRNKEKKLYKLSDHIGCMSPANVDYLIKHNPYIDKNIVRVLPNSIDAKDITNNETSEIRNRYKIPQDKKVFIYGGNLGKPQDIPFVIECLKANENKDNRFFVICGAGTEYPKLKAFVDENNPKNVLLLNGLPKEEYDKLALSCDVGLIFLDHRFTIPNFPSRLLSYMQSSMPVLACTDACTDLGETIIRGNFGWWCESNDAGAFTTLVDKICHEDLIEKGKNARKYLEDNYTSQLCYEIIMGEIK